MERMSSDESASIDRRSADLPDGSPGIVPEGSHAVVPDDSSQVPMPVEGTRTPDDPSRARMLGGEVPAPGEGNGEAADGADETYVSQRPLVPRPSDSEGSQEVHSSSNPSNPNHPHDGASNLNHPHDGASNPSNPSGQWLHSAGSASSVTHRDDSLPTIEGYSDLVPIGRGGFSMVYSAIEELLHRRVAIKVITGDDDAVARLERELRALGMLDEVPNIISAHSVVRTSRGQPALIMRLFTTSLSRLVRSTGPQPMHEVQRWATQLAAGLDAAHERGVIHRDLKPENVLLDDAHNAYLADFGIAALATIASGTSTVMSISPPHAPPERLNGASTGDVQGDIYSLASTLYFASTGAAPFGTTKNGGAAGLIERIVNEPVPASELLPPAVIDVFRRAMAKDPAQRFDTAMELANALAAASDQVVPTAERSQGPTEHPTIGHAGTASTGIGSTGQPGSRVQQGTVPVGKNDGGLGDASGTGVGTGTGTGAGTGAGFGSSTGGGASSVSHGRGGEEVIVDPGFDPGDDDERTIARSKSAPLPTGFPVGPTADAPANIESLDPAGQRPDSTGGASVPADGPSVPAGGASVPADGPSVPADQRSGDQVGQPAILASEGMVQPGVTPSGGRPHWSDRPVTGVAQDAPTVPRRRGRLVASLVVVMVVLGAAAATVWAVNGRGDEKADNFNPVVLDLYVENSTKNTELPDDFHITVGTEAIDLSAIAESGSTRAVASEAFADDNKVEIVVELPERHSFTAEQKGKVRDGKRVDSLIITDSWVQLGDERRSRTDPTNGGEIQEERDRVMTLILDNRKERTKADKAFSELFTENDGVREAPEAVMNAELDDNLIPVYNKSIAFLDIQSSTDMKSQIALSTEKDCAAAKLKAFERVRNYNDLMSRDDNARAQNQLWDNATKLCGAADVARDALNPAG